MRWADVTRITGRQRQNVHSQLKLTVVNSFHIVCKLPVSTLAKCASLSHLPPDFPATNIESMLTFHVVINLVLVAASMRAKGRNEYRAKVARNMTHIL